MPFEIVNRKLFVISYHLLAVFDEKFLIKKQLIANSE